MSGDSNDQTLAAIARRAEEYVTPELSWSKAQQLANDVRFLLRYIEFMEVDDDA